MSSVTHIKAIFSFLIIKAISPGEPITPLSLCSRSGWQVWSPSSKRGWTAVADCGIWCSPTGRCSCQWWQVHGSILWALKSSKSFSPSATATQMVSWGKRRRQQLVTGKQSSAWSEVRRDRQTDGWRMRVKNRKTFFGYNMATISLMDWLRWY